MYSGLAIIFDLQVKYNEGFLLALQLSSILFFEDRLIEYKSSVILVGVIFGKFRIWSGDTQILSRNLENNSQPP